MVWVAPQGSATMIKSSFLDRTQVRKSEPQIPKTKFLLRLLSTSASFNLLLGRTQESAFTHSLIHSVTHSLIHSFTHSFIHSCMHACIACIHASMHHSFIHLFVHSFIRSFIHSFVHSFIHFMSCHVMSFHFM